MRLAWTTDLHLNFVTEEEVRTLGSSLAGCDAVAVGGDTGEARDVFDHLQALAETSGRPVYFVLGNHDFYRGSIAEVREAATRITRSDLPIHWLPAAGVVPLAEDTALVGHDCWGDGRAGDLATSDVLLNDFLLIRDLVAHPSEWGERLAALGDEAARTLSPSVEQAVHEFQRVHVLTHAPPFAEGARWEGRITTPDWLPFMVCQAVGDMLREVFEDAPGCRGTVLSGHTHQPARARILPNLEIRTGAAEYAQPRVQQIFELN